MARHLGAPALLEIGTTEIDQIDPPLRPEVRDRLIQSIASFLNNMISYDDARNLFNSAAGSPNIIDRLKEVIDISDDPSQFFSDDPDIDSSPIHKKTKPWSQTEDVRLLAGIYKFGLDNWSNVASFVGNGRTRSQAAQRWSRGLNPRISKDAWSAEEDAMLLRLVQQYGDKAWTKISTLVGNRSDVQCRYHYHQIAKIGPFGSSSSSSSMHNMMNNNNNGMNCINSINNINNMIMNSANAAFAVPRPQIPSQPRSQFAPMPQRLSFPEVQVTNRGKTTNEYKPQSCPMGPDARFMAEQRIASELRSANEVRLTVVGGLKPFSYANRAAMSLNPQMGNAFNSNINNSLIMSNNNNNNNNYNNNYNINNNNNNNITRNNNINDNRNGNNNNNNNNNNLNMFNRGSGGESDANKRSAFPMSQPNMRTVFASPKEIPNVPDPMRQNPVSLDNFLSKFGS